MKNAPCARLGMRIRPKIKEKPDDNRNSRPPKATLFSVWMIQNCHCIDDSLSPGETCPLCQTSRFSFLPIAEEVARRRKSYGGLCHLPAEAKRRRVGEGAEASPASESAPLPARLRPSG